MNIRGNRIVVLAISCLLFLIGHAVASEAEPEPKVEPVTFQRAIELALKHSTAIAIADLDQRRAERGYAEARAAYTPQVNIGAGLGYSYGFPLSLEGAAPTLFNFTSQQALWNPTQPH